MKVELTLPQIKILIDAACRMECDDIWDQYSISDEHVLERAKNALQDAVEKAEREFSK